MRAVLDNTVYYAAVGLQGAGSLKALQAWRDGRFDLITSKEIMQEVERVLRLKGATEQGIELTLNALRTAATVVEPSEKITACRDKDDNKILAAAIAGHADCIVSDDKDLRALTPFRGIEIITVNRFLRRLGIHKQK